MVIDPATEWEIETGSEIRFGGALTFDKIINPIVYPNDREIRIEGLNHG